MEGGGGGGSLKTKMDPPLQEHPETLITKGSVTRWNFQQVLHWNNMANLRFHINLTSAT